MVTDQEMKSWKDAGHVARRAIEHMRSRITAGRTWFEIAEEAEAFIRRKGGKPAFPTTIGVNEIAAHFTPDHLDRPPSTWEKPMIFEDGDLVKIDIGVQSKSCQKDTVYGEREAQMEVQARGGTVEQNGNMRDNTRDNKREKSR